MGPTPEAVREKAVEHLHSHHGLEYADEPLQSRLDAAIFRVPL